MKYCKKCKMKFDTEDNLCPSCGAKLYEMPQNDGEEINDNETAEIISTMTITGIL